MTMEFGRRPSNGTEGDFQRAQTCARCTVDHDGGWHDVVCEGDESCPIIFDALVGDHSYPNPEGPPEWGNDLETGEWVCTGFKGPCACKSTEGDGVYVVVDFSPPHPPYPGGES